MKHGNLVCFQWLESLTDVGEDRSAATKFRRKHMKSARLSLKPTRPFCQGRKVVD
jgi:hypothetical protein